MFRRSVLRLATWSLGIAGILASAVPTARAEYIRYTTTASITGVTNPVGATITSGFENYTQGAFVQSAPYFGVLINNGSPATNNEVRVLGLMSDPAQTPIAAFSPSGTDIVIAAFDPVSGASSPSNAIDFNYSLVVNVTDFTTPTGTVPDGTGTFTVTGRITGSFGAGQTLLTNLEFATTPINGIFMTTNGDTFTVSFSGFTPPGASDDGTLGVHILSARSVPEPASAALLCLGGLGFAAFYRRRKAKTSP